MNDVPLRGHDEKRETHRNDSTESEIAEKNEAEGTAAPREARQEELPAGAARGETPSQEGATGSNLAAKRAMATDLIGMGFSEAQACRILHISRQERRKGAR